MTTDPPPSTDDPWDDEGDLPPALSAGLHGKSVTAGGAPAASAGEDRDTVLPPVPGGEYVQRMMELGELDDPSGSFTPAPGGAPPPVLRAPRAYTPTPARGLRGGTFDEIDSVGTVPRRTPSPAASPARRRSSPSFTPAPRAAVAAVRLPVPRAPSVPPDEASALDQGDPSDVFEMAAARRQAPSSSPPPSPPAVLDPSAASSRRREVRVPESGSTSRADDAAPAAKPARPVAAVGLRLGQPARRPGPGGPHAPGASIPRVPAPSLIEPVVSLGSSPPSPDSEPAPNSIPDRAREMQALFDAHNYTSALVLAESVLTTDPDHAQARRCADGCREVLAEKYLDRLGGRGNVPRVVVTPDEIRWLALDHRAGFLLSCIDGCMSIDEVLDASSMPALDALRMMYELREQGAIEIVEPRGRPGRR